MLAYLKILRPLNGLMSVIAVWIGSLLAGYPLMPRMEILLGFISVFFVSGGGMVINDFFDIEIDKLNKPNRPLPSGKISRHTAVWYSAILFLVGVSAAFMIGYDALIIAVISAGLLIAYAASIKKTILVGNLVISGLVALTFIFGGIIANNYTPVLPLALLAFLSNVAREIYKTIDDALGDQKYDVNSVAIKLGVKNARMIANIFLIVAVIFSFVPYFLGLLGMVYLFFVIIADIIFLATAVVPVAYSSKLVKIGMLVALISFIAGAYALTI